MKDVYLGRPRPPRYVFDGSALAVYLSGADGHDPVSLIIEAARAKRTAAYLTMFGLAEMLVREEWEGGAASAESAWARIERLPLKLVDIDRILAVAAAHVKAEYQLASADPFAAVLAERQQAVLLTNNVEYRKIENLVTIEWLPPEADHQATSEKEAST